MSLHLYFFKLDYARPACLPYSDDPSLENYDVTITGWGNYSSSSKFLKKKLEFI
jgi:hypothetical protein